MRTGLDVTHPTASPHPVASCTVCTNGRIVTSKNREGGRTSSFQYQSLGAKSTCRLGLDRELTLLKDQSMEVRLGLESTGE